MLLAHRAKKPYYKQPRVRFIPSKTLSYTVIGGATSQSYTLVEADMGYSVYLHVTATNAYGTAEVDSNALGAVIGIAPSNTLVPQITGNFRIDGVLTVNPGTWVGTPTPTFSYQWKRDAVNIGTNATTYTVVAGDVTHVISCVVTATNSVNMAQATATGGAVALSTYIPDPTIHISIGLGI